MKPSFHWSYLTHSSHSAPVAASPKDLPQPPVEAASPPKGAAVSRKRKRDQWTVSEDYGPVPLPSAGVKRRKLDDDTLSVTSDMRLPSSSSAKSQV